MKDIKEINKILQDHEKRIRVLEGSGENSSERKKIGNGKQKTLREIIKGRKFKNGQQQIAVIVGYHENTVGASIHEDKIKIEWSNAKMTNKYSKNFLDRAKDELIRVHPDGTCDLTQTGEDFFDKFLKNESADTTSK